MTETKCNVAKGIQEWGVTCEEGKYSMGFPVFKILENLWRHRSHRSMCMQGVGWLLSEA